MVKLQELSHYLTNELEISRFPDASVNGIQVEGRDEINRVCVAVDAGLSVIEEAAERQADLLLVHHGLFWGGGPPVVGIHKKTLETLLKNGITLFAVHLPLDAHPVLGNNFALAEHLGLVQTESAFEVNGQKIGAKGRSNREETLDELVQKLAGLPGGSSPIISLPFGPERPQKIGICSGAAADELHRYEQEGFDTFITGEPRQFAYHFCRERGLNAIFAGHYRSETLGVRRVAERLKQVFGVQTDFIDQPTGI